MNTKIILDFLNKIAANNNREWFQDHKKEYDAAKKEFEGVLKQRLRHLQQWIVR